jgi:hypothetical protein
MSVISTFNEIKLKPNSLVVLDIDDTLIYFDNINHNWWKEKFEYYYSYFKDYDNADIETYDIWISHITQVSPKLTDEYVFKFFDDCLKNNCKIILLTARNKNNKNLTIKQLQECKLLFDEKDIYFDENKGDCLKNLITNVYTNFKSIIFVDDLENNLNDVKNSLTNYEIELYKFVNIKNMD